LFQWPFNIQVKSSKAKTRLCILAKFPVLALTLALKARNDKDAELWVEVYKEITDLNYDITCFAARVMNYSESYPADNLIEVTFDLMSRGPVKAGTIVLPSTIMPSAPGS
jgi:hypothetical protein